MHKKSFFIGVSFGALAFAPRAAQILPLSPYDEPQIQATTAALRRWGREGTVFVRAFNAR